MPEDTQPQDAPAAPATPPTPPAATPAPVSTPDFETLLNERIAGVQRSFQKQLNDRDELIRTLQSAQMSEEEREKLAQDEKDAELDRLRTELWLAEQSSKNPKAAEAYRKMLSAEDHEAAFALLDALTATPAPATPEPEPADVVPDVDPNNPSALSFNEEHIVLPDGRVLTEAIADDILKNMTKWPEY